MTDAIETYPMPAHGWTCFFCGEIFKKYGAARDHFGERPDHAPAGCLVKVQPGEELGLLMAMRKAERERDKLQAAFGRLTDWMTTKGWSHCTTEVELMEEVNHIERERDAALAVAETAQKHEAVGFQPCVKPLGVQFRAEVYFATENEVRDFVAALDALKAEEPDDE